MNKRIGVGCDPEVILTKKGIPFASVGLLGGTKHYPRKSKHGYIQEDNVLAEYNIKPAFTAEEFINNNLLVLGDLEDIIKPLGLDWVAKASATYQDDQLQSLQAMTAGCEPDFDAWHMTVNEPPMLMTTGLRSAGGHVHVSFPIEDEDNDRVNLVRTMDCLLGIPSILLDEDKERRKLYGKAGAHRPKYTNHDHPYNGVEYRTLSNFWLQSKSLMGWVFDQTVESVERMKEFTTIINTGHIKAEEIISAINTGNQSFAESFIKTFDIKVAA